ncbi:hypothetical protein X755_12125 [Mesorhizobium sp. LNJC405B00]|nr:hypothetical protein X755_12125 [Mesorhizobium sp. LNJC405B00]
MITMVLNSWLWTQKWETGIVLPTGTARQG